MTERSFRSPSPNRGSPVVRLASDAPPVPSVPADLSQLDRTPSGNQRSSSMEPPARLYSPPPLRQGGRGVSLDRSPQSPTMSPAAAGVSRLSNVPELEREGSQRSSINFSRPMSPQRSPIEQPGRPKSMGWFTGPVTSGQKPRQTLDPIRPRTADGPPSSPGSGLQQALQAAGPVKTKKKQRKMGSSSEGSHLATGTTKLTGTALQTLRGPDESSIDRESVRLKKQGEYIGEGSLRGSGDSTSEAASPVITEQPHSKSTRAGALLSKQPSVVHERPEPEEEEAEKTPSANTSRKIDSPTPKPSLESSRYAPTAAPLESGSTEQILRTPRSSVDAQHSDGKLEDVDSPARLLSPNPARTAHFSAVPVEERNGIKHEPSGRSTSPFKSALKHSPSSSIRTTSPEARFSADHARTLSELSKETQKPKKTARVSFDDAPVVVSGLESSKYADSGMTRRLSDEDLEEIMRPRPALPSFGSIRGRKDVEETRNLPKSSRSTHSTTSPSQIPNNGTDSSNDHRVGGILAQDFASKHQSFSSGSTATPQIMDPNEPLPPEVTSVDGTGYASDTDSTYSADSKELEANGLRTATVLAKTQSPDLPATTAVEHKTHNEPIPSLALIPPTPAAEEEPEERSFSIPGAFPSSSLELDHFITDDTQPLSTEPVQPKAEPPPADTSSHGVSGTTSQVYNLSHLPMATTEDETSDSDNSSIYSDAAEDPSELYGGFASLDAIVDSPLTGPNSYLDQHLPEKPQPTTDLLDDGPPSPTAAHWDKTTAYWRGLSDRRKQELEERALGTEVSIEPSHVEDRTEDYTPADSRSSPKALIAPEQKMSNVKATPATSASVPQPSGKARPSAMKHTLRSSSDVDEPETTHMRTTLRGDRGMATTMRGSSGGLASSRWSSPPPDRESKGALQKKRIPPSSSSSHTDTTPSAKPKPTVMPTLQRRGSADSASSFKRQRSRPSNPDGKITLRRSLRDASPQANSQPPGLQSSRFSIRSLSPTGSTANHHMRGSLRGSMDSNTPTLRSQESKPQKKSRFKSPTRFGKTKSSKQKALDPSPTSKFKSRFADDSDDDDEPRPAFVSRFQDSDDELDSPVELPKGLTPVRGIPRSTGVEDRDSTDLEDSSDELPAIPAVPSGKDIDQAHRTKPVTNGNTQGAALANGSLRDSPEGLAASKHAPRPDIQKRRLSFLGLGKQRSSSVPITSSRPGTSDSVRKPKLQRKNTPTMLSQVPEGSWPLPSPSTSGRDAKNERPNTSDGTLPGPSSAARPDVGKRRSTADEPSSFSRKVSFPSAGEPIYSQKTGRKKKFPRLRRMFGLND
jgi:serine/arginine repetitive matrix protein 2